MKKKLHTTKYNYRSVWFSVLLGIITALIVSGILSLGLTSLVMNGHVELSSTTAIIFMIRAVSVLIGGLLASALFNEKHLMIIGSITLIYLIIILMMGVIAYNESFINFGGGVLSAVAGGVSACIVRLKPPTKRKHPIKYK